MKTARVIAAAAGLLVLAALPAEAQARSRTGFWLDGLVSSARLKLVCNTCSDDVHATGTVVTISAGGTPGRGLLLGVEAQVWTGADAGVGQRVRSVALITQWYPWDAGFYLPAAPDSPTGVWLPRTRQRRARRSTAGGSCSHLPWGTIWR